MSILILTIFLYSPVLSSLYTVSSRKGRSMLEDDPCLDAQQVDHLESIQFSSRFSHLSRPWIRDDSTPKLFTSVGLQYQWLWAKSLPIRGLTPSTTVDDVMRWLDSLNCSFLARDDAVWLSLQRARPIDIAAETSCELEDLYLHCVSHFGPLSCGLYPIENEEWGHYRLEIGDGSANSSIDRLRAQPLRIFDWGSSLLLPVQNSTFTVDNLAIYDDLAGHIYLVDITGKGYHDTCERIIAPPTDDTKHNLAMVDVNRLLRFYELRWRGFSSFSADYADFTNKYIREKYTKQALQRFYCEQLLGGVVNWIGEDHITATCHMIYPEQTKLKTIQLARQIMEHEMGSFWNDTFEPSIREMEAIYVTNKVFVQVRNQLKHRIGANPHLTETDIEPGTPMVDDISEVHRRPIMSKSSLPHQLPRDFPTKTKIVPDHRGGFQELHPDVSRYHEEVVYDEHSHGDDASEYEEQSETDVDKASQMNSSKTFSPFLLVSFILCVQRMI